MTTRRPLADRLVSLAVLAVLTPPAMVVGAAFGALALLAAGYADWTNDSTAAERADDERGRA